MWTPCFYVHCTFWRGRILVVHVSLASFESSVQNVMVFCKKHFWFFNKFSEPILGGHLSLDINKVTSKISTPFFSPPHEKMHKWNLLLSLLLCFFDIDGAMWDFFFFNDKMCESNGSALLFGEKMQKCSCELSVKWLSASVWPSSQYLYILVTVYK